MSGKEGGESLELESCPCTEDSLLTSHQPQDRNKRFSIVVEEELLRNGYPSLLIVNGQNHLRKAPEAFTPTEC